MHRPRRISAGLVRVAVAFVVLLPLTRCLLAIQPEVVTEDVVTSYTSADNGAGPLWCYGSPLIVRVGETVYVSTIETGKDVPPLCNTRWQLWRRDPGKWQLVSQEPNYRQREPCPLVTLAGGELFLSTHPSTQPVGTRYGRCRPSVVAFSPRDLSASPQEESPVWLGKPNFTDHSYRGFAADRERGQLLLLNIDAATSEQFVSLRDKTGSWRAKGKIRFPIRAAYPQVALRDGAAHVMAIGDIREPNLKWRHLKSEKLKRDWDYVFRRLFYTFTGDVSKQPFAEPMEIDSVEKTAGYINNLDLHVDREGAAHVLYLKQPHLYEFIRDAYFPGEAMTTSLEYAVIQDGRVARRKTLAATPKSGNGFEPSYARFHVAPGGRLYVVTAGRKFNNGKANRRANYVQQLKPDRDGDAIEIKLKYPFRKFFTTAPRGGSLPSTTIDLFGAADDASNLRYAAVKLRE